MSIRVVRRGLVALLVVVALLSLAGMVLLIIQAESTELAAFELLAFSISVIAVFLALLGAITSVNQTRAMERISKNIKEAIEGLKGLDAESASIKRKLSQDYALAKDIAKALADAGILAEDSIKQKKLASHIEKTILNK